MCDLPSAGTEGRKAGWLKLRKGSVGNELPSERSIKWTTALLSSSSSRPTNTRAGSQARAAVTQEHVWRESNGLRIERKQFQYRSVISWSRSYGLTSASSWSFIVRPNTNAEVNRWISLKSRKARE